MTHFKLYEEFHVNKNAPSSEAVDAFIEYMESELEWNGAQLSYEEPNSFYYTCLPGSSVIPDIKDALKKAGISAQVNWDMEPSERRESAGNSEHYYKIAVKTDLNSWYFNHRGEFLGKKHGIIENANSNYELAEIKDGEYDGSIKGYDVYIDSIDSGFKTTTGYRNVYPIKVVVVVKNGVATVYSKQGVLFSSEEAQSSWKTKFPGGIETDPTFQRVRSKLAKS